MDALFLMLAIVGSLSPLLTGAWLWQVKEWRMDRLLEHLRREGWTRQLWGRVRPAIIVLFVLGAVFTARPTLFSLAALAALSALTLAQIALGKQRRPVPTGKALVLTGTAALLTVAAATGLVATGRTIALPLLVLLQPVMLLLAWLLWKPVDLFLKTRILHRARAARRGAGSMSVIGVTGSVGKTTTKELLACVLSDLDPAVTPAHVNSEIGVARWMTTGLRAGTPRAMVIEMGAYRRGEIALLCSFSQPTMGVVTHVGTQHIALFGSQEALFQAKAELVRALPADGCAFLNGDNELCRQMKDLSPGKTVIVGTGGRCDLEAFDIEETPRGIRFRARDTVFDVPLHGTHNVTNVLLAIAVGETLGIAPVRMRELLREFRPFSNTFAVREESGVRILDDTHNGSAASTKAAIAWARTQTEQTKILLTAGLIEMGDHQAPAEAELGALAAEVFDRLIVIDEGSRANFAAGGTTVEMIDPSTERVPAGALLVCTGRMPQSLIRRLLPLSR